MYEVPLLGSECDLVGSEAQPPTGVRCLAGGWRGSARALRFVAVVGAHPDVLYTRSGDGARSHLLSFSQNSAHAVLLRLGAPQAQVTTETAD